MKALVIGHGSIGKRHVRVLSGLKWRVAVLSRREIQFEPRFGRLDQALSDFGPDYVVIANETREHSGTLKELLTLGFKGSILMEKPLASEVMPAQAEAAERIFVAYNLRFHPVLRALKKKLDGKKILSAQIYSGKFLPDWRPQGDYRRSYSAKSEEGGGVLRDLSHELDYLTWIFGLWESLTALGGHYSDLEIQSDDIFSFLVRTRRCPVVGVQINYVDRQGRRELVVNTGDASFRADLINNTLEENGVLESFELSTDDTYRLEHEAVFDNQKESLCSYEEGNDVLKMIEACEKSARDSTWVSRT